MTAARTSRVPWLLLFLALASAAAWAQLPGSPPPPAPLGAEDSLASKAAARSAPTTAPATPAPSAPAAPPSPVTGIRNKISAGDLPSAESILEVHREKYGEDGPWLAGLGWLARGALLVGDTAAARRYVSQARVAVGQRLASTALDKDRDAESALGAVIEVEAQLVERRRGRAEAAKWLRAEIARHQGPVAFQSRLHKRLNLLTLEGAPAPELVSEARLGTKSVPTLASLRGKPVVLFLWAEWCGDCKAQAASLARVTARHRESGVTTIALTRWYETGDSARAAERVRADSMWTAVYAGLADVPLAVSTRSMIEYGGSATPTFVFIDRKGIVRRYTATRLSEERLDQEIRAIAAK